MPDIFPSISYPCANAALKIRQHHILSNLVIPWEVTRTSQFINVG